MTFSQAFIYLLAAVISVPLAKRLGLGSVLGYLFAGVVIGPFCFGLVETEGQDVRHVAEFGVSDTVYGRVTSYRVDDTQPFGTTAPLPCGLVQSAFGETGY
jgi:predicted Kef-type K+ transport protein